MSDEETPVSVEGTPDLPAVRTYRRSLRMLLSLDRLSQILDGFENFEGQVDSKGRLSSRVKRQMAVESDPEFFARLRSETENVSNWPKSDLRIKKEVSERMEAESHVEFFQRL